MSFQSIHRTCRLVFSVAFYGLIFSTSTAFGKTLDTYFHFANGNKAVYKVNDHKDRVGYKIFLIEPKRAQLSIPVLDSKNSLSKIEYHEDSNNASGLHESITKELAKGDSSTFTWFQDSESKSLMFEDGTVVPVAVPDWTAVSARLIETRGEKYVYLSYKNDAEQTSYFLRLGADGAPAGLTAGAKMIQLDNEFHANLHFGANDFQVKNRILAFDKFPRINLGTLDIMPDAPADHGAPAAPKARTPWKGATPSSVLAPASAQEIEYEGQTYSVKAVQSDSPILTGTFVTRLSDSVTFKADLKPSMDLKLGKGKISEKDGILTIPGVLKQVDLKAFESEIRRFSHLRLADPIRNVEHQFVDTVADVAKTYKDLVIDSRNFPKTYVEKSDPVVIQALAEAVRSKRSAAVLGKAGTGKTAAIRAFARDIGLGLIPGLPRTMQVYKVDMAVLSSGTELTGMIQQRIMTLVSAAQQSGCIYFIDELHTMAGIGTSKSQENDITQYIKGPIEFGEMILLGATTSMEFEMAFGGDGAFMQRFEQVKVSEPKGDDLFSILQARMKKEIIEIPGLPSVGSTKIDRYVIEEAIRLSTENALTTAQPRASVDLLRVAYAKMGNRGLEGRPADLQAVKDAALAEYKFDPAFFDLELAEQRLNHLEEGLNAEVIGQANAKAAIVELWERKLYGVGDSSQINSILFVGPPGVGKTRVAEVSATLMGYEKTIIEMNKYHEGGIEEFRREIYEAIRKHQFRVMILDEFEKAHRSVQDSALSMLQSGEFTVQVPRGRGVSYNEVNAKHALFILTSNAAGDYIRMQPKTVDKELRMALVDGGISEPVVSRLEQIVPLKNPTLKDYHAGVALYLAKTLQRESLKHKVDFVLVKRGQDTGPITAGLQQLREAASGKSAEQVAIDLKHFLQPHVQEYIEAMGAGFVQDATDFRDVKRLMLKIEKQMVKALRARVQAGDTVFIEWDESFVPEQPAAQQ